MGFCKECLLRTEDELSGKEGEKEERSLLSKIF